MILARFAALRARLGAMPRLVLALCAVALCGAFAWFGTSMATEVPMLVVVAFAALALGAAYGAGVTTLAAIACYESRIAHHAHLAISNALLLAIGGFAMSALLIA